jgi:two-component sensor histidine kinase
MKRILRSRLPERFADRVPPLVVEIAVGVGVAVLLTLVRFPFFPVIGDRAPFALVYVAMVGATVLAGWRSGLLTLALGQLMAWYLIIDPANYSQRPQQYVESFVVTTLSQLFILVIVWLYQREVDRAWSQREAQVDLIHQALAEMDHRTLNNYQTVLALVSAQARRADAPVKAALEQVSARIRAIAMASKQLAIGSHSLGEVRASHHLSELCSELQQGLSRPGVSLESDFEDIGLSADEITWVSVLVNELVTNALKHAFPDDREGVIRVALRKTQGSLELVVEDNGVGMKGGARGNGNGLGTRLVQTFTKQLGATHQLETGSDGTRHRIMIPAKA